MGVISKMLSSRGTAKVLSMTRDKARQRITRVTEICLALPGATRTEMGQHASFRAGSKVFAYLLNDHHGDGIPGICCKALPGDNQRLIEANARRFYMPALHRSARMGGAAARLTQRGLV